MEHQRWCNYQAYLDEEESRKVTFNARGEETKRVDKFKDLEIIEDGLHHDISCFLEKYQLPPFESKMTSLSPLRRG